MAPVPIYHRLIHVQVGSIKKIINVIHVVLLAPNAYQEDTQIALNVRLDLLYLLLEHAFRFAQLLNITQLDQLVNHVQITAFHVLIQPHNVAHAHLENF